ncbi:MAG: pseudoazurin [Pseudomonadota bacterium]
MTKNTSPASIGRKAVLGAGAAVLAATASLSSIQAMAADHEVQMLNQGPGGAMVFEPAYIKADIGDTVTFKPTQRGGHNTKSAYVPAGAEAWDSAPDQELTVELTAEGVYVYICKPHMVMGMAGVIQVGEATDLEAATEAANKAAAAFALNKDRLTSALAQIQ